MNICKLLKSWKYRKDIMKKNILSLTTDYHWGIITFKMCIDVFNLEFFSVHVWTLVNTMLDISNSLKNMFICLIKVVQCIFIKFLNTTWKNIGWKEAVKCFLLPTLSPAPILLLLWWIYLTSLNLYIWIWCLYDIRAFLCLFKIYLLTFLSP